MKNILLATLLILSASWASATVVSADFKAAADLPYCCARSGPVTLTSLGRAVGTGLELDGSSTFANPSNWRGGVVYADLNPATGLLTLDSQDQLDFETFVFTISNINFSGPETITGLTMLTNNLTTKGIVPTLSFTNNSIQVRYDKGSIFNFTGNNATFQLAFSAVPEPGSWALIALALAGLTVSRRFRKN